ncbi:uncharacterized protein LOC141715495 [Apium graveolens]|uniref:uncharacterized protein LOC141715463 n=1 Tax=Apium graveolens TaxID=4045 RepID=UPI003D799237
MGTLPEDKFQARCLRYQAAKYVEYDDILYKRGFSQPLLHRVDLEEGNYILRKVHKGICGNHSRGDLLALKRFANYSIAPATSLTSMVSPWPIAMWGIDLIGEFPKAKGGVKYAVVVVDYLTKWAKAMPLEKITIKKIKDFIFNFIVCRFGISYKLISDNEKKFDRKKPSLKKIKVIVQNSDRWFFGLITPPRSTTGKSLFTLTYGYEAMIPVKVEAGSLRRDFFVERDAELELAAYQQKIARYFNKKVKSVPYKVGDLALRKVMPNTKIAQHGVLGANWEGSYKVKAIL